MSPFSRLVIVLFFVVVFVLAIIFGKNMKVFQSDISDAVSVKSCLDNPEYLVVSEQECYSLDGDLVLGRFDDVGPDKVCCSIDP